MEDPRRHMEDPSRYAERTVLSVHRFPTLRSIEGSTSYHQLSHSKVIRSGDVETSVLHALKTIAQRDSFSR